MKRSQRVAASSPIVRFSRGGPCSVIQLDDDRIQRLVDLLDALDVRVDHLERRGFTASDHLGQLDGGQVD